MIASSLTSAAAVRRRSSWMRARGLGPSNIEFQVAGVAIEAVVRYPKGQAKQWGQVSKAVQPLAKQLACDLGFAGADVFGEARWSAPWA
mmetsp:Transcript_39722/g.123739  ORF Transcript_39722/g.123739 Transcript_39722/m.123739 type:complete len:89 (-) Transcript_39722:105-371(-)